MRFDGEWDTAICEDCDRTVSESDDCGWEDTSLCSGCSARRTQEFVNSPCNLCKKPMGKDSDGMWNCDGETAHTKCVKKLSEKKQEEQEWSDEV